jgi:hypothetical protein
MGNDFIIRSRAIKGRKRVGGGLPTAMGSLGIQFHYIYLTH